VTFASFGAAATSGGAGTAFVAVGAAGGGSAGGGAALFTASGAAALGGGAPEAAACSLLVDSAGALLQPAEPTATAIASVEKKGREVTVRGRRMAFSAAIFRQEKALRNLQETALDLRNYVHLQLEPIAWSIFPPHERGQCITRVTWLVLPV
jgi:hypothetical protein